MTAKTTWGIVATIKAPSREILDFAAHHLDLGAHRVHIYLDEDAPEARRALSDHPNCRVTLCNDAYWKSRDPIKGKPAVHETCQTANATHCYTHQPEVDWLAHIDVDEFLWPGQQPLGDQLSSLSSQTNSVRIRPIEALAPDPNDPPPTGAIWFKACHRLLRQRRDQTRDIYPTFGEHLNGGFLSHVAGKVFARTGMKNVRFRIHDIFINRERYDTSTELSDTQLCHLHARDIDHWRKEYRYRMQKGSYRANLKPTPRPGGGGMNMHSLLSMLEKENGEAALIEFFNEVRVASPALRHKLQSYGLLHQMHLDLDAKRKRHFPQYA
jgi:hypothetical protein